jgi:hypothetical protein
MRTHKLGRPNDPEVTRLIEQFRWVAIRHTELLTSENLGMDWFEYPPEIVYAIQNWRDQADRLVALRVNTENPKKAREQWRYAAKKVEKTAPTQWQPTVHDLFDFRTFRNLRANARRQLRPQKRGVNFLADLLGYAHQGALQ